MYLRVASLGLLLAGLMAVPAAPAMAAGVTLNVACESSGPGREDCQKVLDAWSAKTGNKANLVQVPTDSDARLALYQQQLAAHAGDIDVYEIDTIWPGLIGQNLLDLNKYIPKDVVDQHAPALIANNTYQGKLVGLPYYTDVGRFYYRTDLLKKYGFDHPPTTWEEMAKQAAVIQAGERKTNPNFFGFVFQGKNYEGLTCDALEWIKSYGGGTIVDDGGKITVNNPQAVAALTEAASWVGTIAPDAVTTYAEEESRNAFQAGNAAFMRNWTYAYALAEDPKSPIAGKVAIAALPAGPGGTTAATLGGWQLAVNAYSAHPAEAADLVAYMGSAAEQKRRIIEISQNATIPALYNDPEVIASSPIAASFGPALANSVARPTTVTGTKYNQVSLAFASAVYSVLTKQATAADALKSLEAQLTRIKGRAW